MLRMKGVPISSSSGWTVKCVCLLCEDRAHRIGQKDTVFVYHLVIEDTIDAYIAKRAVEKTEIIEQSTGIKNGGMADVEA